MFGFLLGGLFLILLFVSCSKDDLKPTVTATFDPKFETYHKLKSFMERSEGKQPTNPGLLPRSGYSVNDIIEYVEGTLNLVYADASLTWEDYQRGYDTFSISLVSGYADEEDVIDLFEQVRDSASVFFYGITESDKFPKLYDVVNVLSTTSTLEISVMTMVGKVHKDLTPFGQFDYWDIFEDGNTCDPEDNYNGAPDAGIKMSEALNLDFKPYGCYFFTDELIVNSQNEELDPSLSDLGWRQDNPTEQAGDWVVDFRTLKTVCDEATSACLEFAENGIYCLAPNEMNYYFSSIRSIYWSFFYETGLQLMISDIGLSELNTGSVVQHTWESNDVFGKLNYCDEGNEYPFFLPLCC